MVCTFYGYVQVTILWINVRTPPFRINVHQDLHTYAIMSFRIRHVSTIKLEVHQVHAERQGAGAARVGLCGPLCMPFLDQVWGGGGAPFAIFSRCGHCKGMKPAWDQLGAELAGSNSVLIGDVDCTVEKDLCSRFDVKGYPTIKYWNSDAGKDGIKYSGGRDFQVLRDFVKDSLEVCNGCMCNEMPFACPYVYVGHKQDEREVYVVVPWARYLEIPSLPGRRIFGFSVGGSSRFSCARCRILRSWMVGTKY